MASYSCPSASSAEIIEVDFVRVEGGSRSFRLLVDTGFTGESSVAIGAEAEELIRAMVPSADTTGALQGSQERALVICRIPALGFQATVLAIIANVSKLALPPGVNGLAGLNFLRLFERWGAERTENGWQFVLVK